MNKTILTIATMILFSGCATWEGIKSDTNSAFSWSKHKVNEGADYVKEKTE